MKSIQNSRKLLRALENLSSVTLDVEEHFTDELYLFFKYLCRKILENVDLDQPLNAIFYQQVGSVVAEYWSDYEEILSTYVDKSYQIGRVHHEVLLNASKAYAEKYSAIKSENKEQFFKPNAKVSKRLKTYKFEASEHTKSRVTEEINKTLGEAYREGWGRENVTKHIQQKFNNLSTWESRRIAVTEVNSARNIAHHNELIKDNIRFGKWVAAKDDKVRPSHQEVNGEIVPIGERYSNGLLHPGDKQGGPIKEWVSCRCTQVAFIIPQGYEAPAFWPFHEEDLVKIEEIDLLNTELLTDKQKEYYQSLQNELASAETRWEEAKEKWIQHLTNVGLSKEEALEVVQGSINSLEKGETVYPPMGMTDLFNKIKKSKDKIKKVEDIIQYLNKNQINISKEIKKINNLADLINPEELKEILSQEQFYDLMDIKNILKSNAGKLEFKYGIPKVDEIEKILKDANKYEKNINQLNDVLNKAKKLNVKQPTLQSSATDIKQTMGKVTDDMDFTIDGYKGLQKFAKKHKNKKTEYGIIMDIKTGEKYSPVFHGGKGSVSVPEKEIVNAGLNEKEIKKLKKKDPWGYLTGKYKKQIGEQVQRDYAQSEYCAVVHNHPQDGYHIFSDADLAVTFNSKKVKYCVAISKQETWILKTTNQNVSKKVTDKIVKEWRKTSLKTKKQSEKEIDEWLNEIKNIKDRRTRIQKLKELNEYLKSPEWIKKQNDELNNALLKFSKDHEQVFVLKKVKTDDLTKEIKILEKQTNIKKPKDKSVRNNIVNTRRPFNKSNYKKDNESTRELEKKQDILQHQIRYKESERESMNYWGHSGFEDINGYICNTDTYKENLKSLHDVDSYIQKIKEHIKNIDHVIQESPGLEQNTILYRQGHWDVKLKKGDISTFKGYSSTTYKPSVTSTFSRPGRYKITIYADKGSKGVRLNDQFGGIDGEREWLLPRDQKFEVIDVDNVKQRAIIRLID